MWAAALLFGITLTSIVVKSISALLPLCILCPCGSSNQNYTQCIDESLLKDFTCERWLHCQTCNANTTFCITCPPGRFGPSCSKISGEHIRRKRQDGSNPLNNPRQFGSCPFIERPESGSIRCSKAGNERSCKAQCIPGYHFEGEDDVSEMTLRCRGGIWTPRTFFPPCKSGGICEVQVTGAGSYNCTIDMDGTHCDITCEDRPQGSFHCYPGRQWQPPLPFCTVPKEQTPCLCQNGRVCDDNGRCKCPAGRTGTYCENLERQRVTCPDPGIPRYGSRLNPDGSDASYSRRFEDGESVIFTCNGDSFALQGASFITCFVRNWSENRPRCVRSSVVERDPPSQTPCRHPGVDVNGRIEDHPLLDPRIRGQMFPPSTELRFLCNEGYTLEGSTSLICQRSGEWSSAPPVCIRIATTTTARPTLQGICRHPGVDVNGRIEGDSVNPRERIRMFPVDSSLKFSCNEGFELEGSTVIYCLSNGKWTSVPPNCERSGTATVDQPSEPAKLCPVPRLNPNVEVKDFTFLYPRNFRGFEPGQELTLKCREGYDLEGSDLIRCHVDGQWSSESPKCISDPDISNQARCENPGRISNGRVFVFSPAGATSPSLENDDFDFPYGTHLKYTCDDGFVLIGADSMNCESNSYWSQSVPMCFEDEN